MFINHYKKIIVATLAAILLSANSVAMTSDKSGPIVVTIKPLYSLLAHLTDGIEQPVLLMKQAPSGHHFSLRPSERSLLADARMIVWVGQEMEASLTKVIKQRENSTDHPVTVVSVMKSPGLKLLNLRSMNSHRHEHHDSEHSISGQTVDPHIWLSAHNASNISTYLSEWLIADSPENTGRYKHNLQRLLKKIEDTQHHIKLRLNPHSNTVSSAFITYHDAFQYFEVENNLNYSGTVTFSEESGPGLKYLQQIKSRITAENIHCLVYQPPRPAIIDSLVKQTSINTSALDPLGLTVSDNKNAWFELMLQMADGFGQCLKP